MKPPPTFQLSLDGAAFTTGQSPYAVSLDGAAFTAGQSPYAFSALASRPHTFAVRRSMPPASLDATPASFNWQIDVSQPSARITFPTPVSVLPTRTNSMCAEPRATENTITGVAVNGVVATSTDRLRIGRRWFRSPRATTISCLGHRQFRQHECECCVSPAMWPIEGALARPRGPRAGRRCRILTANRAECIVALRMSDGRASILSDATHGTGPTGGFARGRPEVSRWLASPRRDTAVALGGGEVLDVNLTNGNRTVIPTDAPRRRHRVLLRACLQQPVRAHVCRRGTAVSTGGRLRVFSVDLSTGARPSFPEARHTRASAPSSRFRGVSRSTPPARRRLLVADDILDAVVAVDLADGNRAVLSSALAPNVTGTGPAIASRPRRGHRQQPRADREQAGAHAEPHADREQAGAHAERADCREPDRRCPQSPSGGGHEHRLPDPRDSWRWTTADCAGLSGQCIRARTSRR